MSFVLIDSNILIDLSSADLALYEQAACLIDRLHLSHRLVINPIIYAEFSVGFPDSIACDASLACLSLSWENISRHAAYLAGKAFLKYRRAGGARTSPLPDFFIGAHAQAAGHAIATRDVSRYQTYFPSVKLITP